jgi:flagellar biogenesis protein FliO
VGIKHVEKGTAGQDGWIRAARPLLAVGVTLLLALGAVSLSSAKGSTIHADAAWSQLWLLFAFLSFVGAATAAYQLWIRRYGAEQASEAAQRLNRAVLAMFAVLAFALPVAFYLSRPATAGGNGLGCASCVITPATARRPTVDTDIPDDKRPQPPKSLHLAPFLTVLGIVVAVLIIAVAAYFVVRLLRRVTAEPIQGLALPAQEMVDDAELERAMLAGREALAGEARAAIIACYAAMEDSLRAAGVALLTSDSPADLLARAAAGGVIEGAAPGRLAELFREARFSTHEMGQDKLLGARAALDEILAQVTARQQAAAQAAAESAAGTKAVAQ